MMELAPLSRALLATGLAVALSVTVVAVPAKAAFSGPATLPHVCAYLGVVNGTRSIDPAFAPGVKPAATTGPSTGLGSSVRLASSVTTASSAAPPKASAYCHRLPPFVPIGR
jgi:hypothetical protein